MTTEEAKNYLRQKSEAKIYSMMNGWLFMENDKCAGANYVIPSDKEGVDLNDDMSKLIPRLGEWVVENMGYIEENNKVCSDGESFGWKVKIEIEPIYTNDFLLSTQLEEQR